MHLPLLKRAFSLENNNTSRQAACNNKNASVIIWTEKLKRSAPRHSFINVHHVFLRERDTPLYNTDRYYRNSRQIVRCLVVWCVRAAVLRSIEPVSAIDELLSTGLNLYIFKTLRYRSTFFYTSLYVNFFLVYLSEIKQKILGFFLFNSI